MSRKKKRGEPPWQAALPEEIYRRTQIDCESEAEAQSELKLARATG
jgi:hypothetical protein